ncbi:hypothetical protein ACJX0J_038703 [Zea mays]
MVLVLDRYKIKEIESSKPKKRKSIHAQQYRSMGGATAMAYIIYLTLYFKFHSSEQGILGYNGRFGSFEKTWVMTFKILQIFYPAATPIEEISYIVFAVTLTPEKNYLLYNTTS